MILNIDWYKVFYWMTVADNVKHVTGILSIVLGIYMTAAIIAALGAFEETFPNWEKGTKRIFYIFSIAFFISLFSWMLLPTKRDMIGIVAGGAIGNFVSRDSSSQAIPAELTRYVRGYLKKNADDLDEDVKAELGLSTPKDKFVDKLKSLSKEQIIEYLKSDSTIVK